MKLTFAGKKAVIYSRYSSDMQRTESIDAQLRACKDYATKKEMEVVGIYIDEAVSGTINDRVEFQKMLSNAEPENFDYIIVHKLDRFERDQIDLLLNVKILQRKCMHLLSVRESFTEDPYSFGGRMMLSLTSANDEYYVENLRVETLKGLKENAHNGKHTGGIAPLGYDIDKDTMKLVINGHESQAVKIIFSMYLDGCSYNEIIKVLNMRGFKTKLGNAFVATSLHGILRNPKYTGVYTFGRSAPKDMYGKRNGHKYRPEDEVIKVEGAVPALVSEQDFELVAEKMKTRKHRAAKYRAKRTYLLSGKIICGRCGRSYVGNARNATKTQPEYLSYRCNNRAGEVRCSGWEIPAELIEGIVLNELANIIFNDSLLPKIKAKYNTFLLEQNGEEVQLSRALQRKIREIQKSMDNIKSVIKQTPSEPLVLELNELYSEQKDCQKQLQELENNIKTNVISDTDLLESFNRAKELLKAGKLANVRVLIERYIEKITITGDKIDIQFNIKENSGVNQNPAVLFEKEKTQTTLEDVSVFVPMFQQSLMLASCGGESGIRTRGRG